MPKGRFVEILDCPEGMPGELVTRYVRMCGESTSRQSKIAGLLGFRASGSTRRRIPASTTNSGQRSVGSTVAMTTIKVLGQVYCSAISQEMVMTLFERLTL